MSETPSRTPQSTVIMDVPARVLVVDDDPVIRSLLRETLEAYGHQVMEAEDGQKAVALFPDLKPEIVLMDVEMPALDGISACRQLRRLECGKMTPILMVTGVEESDSINRAYQAGATDFISKPINWPVLAQRVRYMLRASRTLRALEVSEGRNRAILEAIPDTICLLDADGQIIEFLGDGKRDKAWPAPDGVGRRLQDIVPASAADDVAAKIAKTLATGRMQSLECSDGDKARPEWHQIRLVRHGSDRVMMLASDVTERVTAAATVKRLAYYDTLTGLPNRPNFLRHLKSTITEARGRKSQTALLFIDLDSFKRINDNLGHSAGDTILKAAAARLSGCMRAGDAGPGKDGGRRKDRLARVGGDEFVILAHDIGDDAEVETIAQRVQEALSNPFTHMGREIVVTPSLGIALYPRDGADAETLMKNADTAMYQAKNSGRNTYRFYTETMSLRSMERLDLELQLRRAVENGELTLHYQPKLCLRDMRVTGVEALLRWPHPEHGPIPPGRFIPLAEETGLIAPISEWVLQRACEQANDWRELQTGGLNVAVNISTKLFTFGNLSSSVWSALCASGLNAEALELEITENLFLRDIDQVRGALGELREMGVSLAVDDFGTGYSSLSYLKRLNVDTLKIDRSFVKDVTTDADDRSICAAIVAMGHSLGLKVIAEGVETPAHLQAVREFGCDEAQGFLFSKAVSADDIPRFIADIDRTQAAFDGDEGTLKRRRTAS